MRRRQKDRKAAIRILKQRIAVAVAHTFPGCEAVFVGQQSRAALKGRTLGYRIRDKQTGKYRSNIVWI